MRMSSSVIFLGGSGFPWLSVSVQILPRVVLIFSIITSPSSIDEVVLPSWLSVITCSPGSMPSRFRFSHLGSEWRRSSYWRRETFLARSG